MFFYFSWKQILSSPLLQSNRSNCDTLNQKFHLSCFPDIKRGFSLLRIPLKLEQKLIAANVRMWFQLTENFLIFIQTQTKKTHRDRRENKFSCRFSPVFYVFSPRRVFCCCLVFCLVYVNRWRQVELNCTFVPSFSIAAWK